MNFCGLLSGSSMKLSSLAVVTFFAMLPLSNALSSEIEGIRFEGSQLVISGSGFGNKNPMVFWDGVDNNTLSQDIGVLSDEVKTGEGFLWSYNSNQYGPPFTFELTPDARSGRKGVVYSGEGHKSTLGDPNYTSDLVSHQLYVSWWYKPSMAPGAEGGSNKFIRVWDDRNGEGTRISWTHMHLTCGAGVTEWGSWTEAGNVNQWNHNEIYINLSENLVETWVNGKRIHLMENCKKSPSHPDKPLYVGMIGFDHGSEGYRSMKTKIDDIYIGRTPARVEISNASEWSREAKREVLPISNWTNEEIVADVVSGVVRISDQSYIYIFDEFGNHNQYGIKVDCTSCPKMLD